ncbi:hypothetical protein CVT25_003127 [Psilocybe cyanescens]|uniref:Uncharacterized protein n=1 Tax=Psilocybe cyanescens TaxID=93625 RepID=A0A409XQK7_PSICY|nr:hypothetical protein CVT25_003127 [Psilocybe cyanescens]
MQRRAPETNPFSSILRLRNWRALKSTVTRLKQLAPILEMPSFYKRAFVFSRFLKRRFIWMVTMSINIGINSIRAYGSNWGSYTFEHSRVNGQHLGRRLGFQYDDHFTLNQSPLDCCVRELTLGRARNPWCGNIFGLRL